MGLKDLSSLSELIKAVQNPYLNFMRGSIKRKSKRIRISNKSAFYRKERNLKNAHLYHR